MKKPPVAGLIVGMGLAGMCTFVLMGAGRSAPATSPSTRPTVRLVPGHFGPMGYFETHCARCHGPYGSFYGPDFGKLPVAELRQTLGRMARGPGNAPLTDDQLDLLLAYQQALSAGQPFVTLVEVRRTKSGVQLEGEITPGFGVTVDSPGRRVPAAVTEHNWTASLPDTPGDCFIVTVSPPK